MVITRYERELRERLVLAGLPGLTRAQVRQAIRIACGTVEDELAAGREVDLVGFGKFHSFLHAARQTHDISTGSDRMIPAHMVARFRPGCHLRDAVEQGPAFVGHRAALEADAFDPDVPTDDEIEIPQPTDSVWYEEPVDEVDIPTDEDIRIMTPAVTAEEGCAIMGEEDEYEPDDDERVRMCLASLPDDDDYPNDDELGYYDECAFIPLGENDIPTDEEIAALYA